MFLHLELGGKDASLIHSLPGKEAPAEIIAYQASVALDHRGHIGPFLFERLAATRPGRLADIERVASLIGECAAAA